MGTLGRVIINDKGLTLIEMLFSFGLLAIVVSSAFFGLLVAHQMSEDSHSRFVALNAARSTLEEIKDTPLANVPNIDTVKFVPIDLPNGVINITTNPASVSTAQVATVTVTVTWAGAQNRQQQLEVTTMRSRV